MSWRSCSYNECLLECIFASLIKVVMYTVGVRRLQSLHPLSMHIAQCISYSKRQQCSPYVEEFTYNLEHFFCLNNDEPVTMMPRTLLWLYIFVTADIPCYYCPWDQGKAIYSTLDGLGQCRSLTIVLVWYFFFLLNFTDFTWVCQDTIHVFHWMTPVVPIDRWSVCWCIWQCLGELLHNTSQIHDHKLVVLPRVDDNDDDKDDNDDDSSLVQSHSTLY